MMQFKHHTKAARPNSIAMSTIALLVLGVVGFALGFAGSAGSATTIDLGAAASFGAISATAMTGAGGNTVVNGDVGSPTSVDATVTNPGFARFDSPAVAAGMVGPMNAVTAAFGAVRGAGVDRGCNRQSRRNRDAGRLRLHLGDPNQQPAHA